MIAFLRNALSRFPAILIITVLLCGLAACNETPPQKFRIGFSQCGDGDLWRKTMLAEMQRELAFHPELELLYRQADDNSSVQINQVRDLLRQGIDLLIISPNEASPLTPVVEEAFTSGIPVIIVDRKIASNQYTNYIGANNYEIGKLAGEYVGNLLSGKGKVVEVIGLPASSPAIERKRGFRDALAAYPSIAIVHEIIGDWVKQRSLQELTAKPELLRGADLVFAHNDVMALGARQAALAAGVDRLKVIGVDALAGKGAGLEMVNEQILQASLLYPTGGSEAIQNAVRILRKEPVPKETALQTLVVDSSNVRIMQLQSDKIAAQQRDIKLQQQKLVEQQRIYNNQRTMLYILALTLLIAVFFAGLLFYSRNLNRRINRQLARKNEEISQKSQQLIEMSAAAAQANEARISFFTNISHEFRTPLTLIIGPIEEMLQQARLQHHAKQQLTLVKKNAIRLLRLVNQLIDFRKLEFNKMQVRATEVDLVCVCKEVIDTFQQIARKRNIDCRLVTREASVMVWADNAMLDKVIFNLMSNAFKFTPDHGAVLIHLEENAQSALLAVEDTGVGMTAEELTHAFDLFYQGDSDAHKGSGLGLALCKELVQLHHGEITANSEKNRGTRFTVALLKGNGHFQEEELGHQPNTNEVLAEVEQHYTEDLLPVFDTPEEEQSAAPAERQSRPLLLLAEDNPELRGFLKLKLQENYDIIEACDGQKGIQQVFEYLPDLVICDVKMPLKDGTALLKLVKSDIRTAHIPIVLLTAKTSKEQQIEALQNKADAYITKPFDMDVLQSTVRSLLSNRSQVKEHASSSIPTHLRIAPGRKNDLRFITEFKSIVENNISNEYFGVEDLCKQMGISKVQLYRKVKALLDTNINEYILQARMQKAKYYLQHEDLTVAEVAYKTGFASPAYFSTVFKNKEGVSPSAFRGKPQ